MIDNCEFAYIGIDNFNSPIYAASDIGSDDDTITVTNCVYGEKVVAGESADSILLRQQKPTHSLRRVGGFFVWMGSPVKRISKYGTSFRIKGQITFMRSPSSNGEG